MQRSATVLVEDVDVGTASHKLLDGVTIALLRCHKKRLREALLPHRALRPNSERDRHSGGLGEPDHSSSGWQRPRLRRFKPLLEASPLSRAAAPQKHGGSKHLCRARW